jgi:N-acetylglucosaminyldiphosphoundecaprenol N-acetyl-beta-D-mannosaminyltransferase
MMMKNNHIKYGYILKSKIAAISFRETIDIIENWIYNKKSKYVCICNTHSLVTAYNDSFFNDVLNNAGLCTPDGMPLVWALKLYGYKNQERVDGPNLMLKLCELAPQKNFKIFLYGGKQDTLERLEKKLKEDFNGINIVGKYSPPFRNLTDDEEREIREMINNSNADLIFVSLGCPKQEIWMYRQKDYIKGVMIGVGAAFDFIVGDIKRPPVIFQKLGLEWFFRLIAEPKRLWKRYAYNNPMFIYNFIKTFRSNKKRTMQENGINMI